MEKALKSAVSSNKPLRPGRTTSAAPISIDTKFAASSSAQRLAEPLVRASYPPIVVLVSNSAEFERVLAQLMPMNESGLPLAEGYVHTWEPVALELSAGRVNVISGAETYSFGEVTVNIPEMNVRRKERLVTLTLKEFRTLSYLLKNPGRVIARDELLNEVWGYQNYPCTRTVDNHILRLRQKLEAEPSSPKHLLTIHSVGYKFLP
jgi:hypothetical protein